METVVLVLQIVIALGIANVWLVRSSKSTAYRGGSATNMKEEFAVYGLSEGVMKLIGAAKLLLAAALIVGIWVPQLIQPAAIGMAVLMVGAVSMHAKVKDPLLKSLPATAMLAMSAIVAIFV
ncbi:MAG: DoxX family protein [Planctomycetota bacterium]|nr:DoxX family protein [Planctomycetota bacterium]